MENKTQNRTQDERTDKNQGRDRQQNQNQQDQQKNQQRQDNREAGRDENMNPQGNRDVRQAPASPNASSAEREDTTSQGDNRLNQSGRERTQHQDSQQPRSRRLNDEQENEDDDAVEQGAHQNQGDKASKSGQKSGY